MHELRHHFTALAGEYYTSDVAYAPAADCTMFSRDRVPFCPLCRHAIERVIDLYSKRP